MALVRFVPRLMFAGIFVLSGQDTLRNPGGRSKRVEDALSLPNPELMVRLNGAAMLVLGTTMALGIKPRLSALGLAAILVPTTYAGHQFWNEEETMPRRMQLVHFEKNVSLMGGLLAYAMTDASKD